MMDYNAERWSDVGVAEQLLEEEWTHDAYLGIQYMQVNRTEQDDVYDEKMNKTYTLLATFQGKIDLTPDVETMADFGVTWEEGYATVEATRIHLDETFINITATTFDNLLTNIANDDVLLFPDVKNPDGSLKAYRIIKITKRGWYANTPMIVAFLVKVLPEFNK
jgi:hypothetical protein